MKKLTLPLLIMLFGVHSVAQADIYKWTDKDGKVHYSATPPKKPQKNVEDIEDKIKASIGKVQPKTSYKVPVASNTESNTPKKQGTSDGRAGDHYNEDRSQARLAYCNDLKRNIHTMENNKNSNLIREGEKKPLSADQIKNQLKKDKANFAKNCGGI
ncbi:MAG: hypothetical protein CSB47_10020 [Proteobacteria bacterium]|nr:MAG: hypothetical protein CSB47_10020 [Pseudomonadota bacterium]